MKKIFAFGKKRKGFSPSSSDTGSVLSLGYEIKEKDLGKVHKAASSGDLAKLKQLAKKNDLNQLDKENRTPLHIACANGHAEVVQFLVERKVKLNLCDNQNRSPLMKAVQCQQERCASTLLEHNANPNLVDINGNTALHLAASIPLATQLLEHEANINALNNDGCTPLTLAVTENHVEIAEFLLKEGADVNTRDQAQRTPLMIAACNGQTSLISLLLRYDADITVKDEKGWTADDYAVINGYHACSHLIIQHGTKRKSQHSPLYLGAGKNKGLLGSPAQGDNVGFSLGRPATNREVDEDNSQAESISRESKCGAGDSWLSSDEDDGLQSIPKKPQKVNLKKLLSASENGRKNERPDFDKSWNESESERESENEAKGNPALPLTIPHSGISQHPASPSPASFSNPPQMTSTPLSNSRKEQDYTEDEYDDDEEDEECSDRKGSNEEDDGETEVVQHGSNKKHGHIAADIKMHKSKGASKDVKRDFLSELGLEASADEEDSPWDSSSSDSPSKQNVDVVKAPAKGKHGTSTSEDKNEDLFYVPSFLRGPRNDRMPKVESLRSVGRPGDLKGQASREDTTDGLGGKFEELPTQPASAFPPASKDSSNATKKIDLMEELGLGDIDDLEDSSDWDTSSSASENIVGPKEVLSQVLGPPALKETNPDCLVPASPADREEDLPSSILEGEQTRNPRRSQTPSQSPPLPSPRTLTPGSTKQLQNQPQPQPRFRKHHVAQDEGIPPPDTVPEDGESDASAKPEEPQEVGGEKKLLSDAGNQCLLQNPKEPSRKSDTDTDKLTKGEAGQRDLKSDSTCKKETTSTQNEQKIEVTDGVKERYVAQNPKRFSATENPKSKVTEEIKIADEFDDLTESSDTATEDMDSLASGYRNASLLIKQLDTSSIDSVSMVKLQNMFLEYERTVQREKGRSSRLAEKISQLEGEQAELKRSLEETRNAKSSLEHQHMELESDFSNLKFVLKQEQEKHRNATALYDKSREQLRVKEEQYLSEAEERQKLELTMRNLELEMRALMNSMKQLEEDNNESQRLLAHERHARALQEGILNSHLHKQKELEAENKRNLNKSNELLEANDREKDLLQQNRSLQEEVTTLRLELEQARAHSRQEEIHLSEESDALKERLEDAKRDLKLNEEALAQTVYRYNGELSTLRAECSVVTAKLEHERQTREKLETEVESARARLTAALQEVERCQDARADAERALQRERDERQRTLEKHMTEMTGQRESIQSLSQQLGTAEARANGLENELHRATLTLTERSLLVETAQRERSQAQARLAELEAALQAEREVAERAVARQEATQERLAQTQSETMLLRQQLEDAQNRGVIKERAVTDAQERFSELLSKLRADCEERVRMAEDWSKEQVAKNGELQEQLLRQEQEKTERETTLRQLQQELADTLKKLSMCEASLEVNSRHRSDLEEEKLRMQKDVDRFKGRLQESEEQHFQTERRLHELQSILKDKEREVITASQKLQEVLSASEGAEKTIRQLEEAMQRLEIENARLDAVAKQQTNRIDFLQKGAQEASVVRNRLEDLVTDLQGNKIHLEDQLHREVKKQSELSHNVQDSHQLWEEELKTRSRLALRLAELEREKAELSSQMDIEKKKAKKIAEQKRSMDIRLDQEMKRNTELQKEMYRLKTLVKTAKKKLKEQDNAELSSPLGGLRGELSHRQLEAESTVTRMKSRVDELSLQLEREERKCSRLEAVNIELKEQLSSLKALNRSNERLEKSKKELEEEVSNLRRQMDAGMMDQKQAEQYRRETEERARQEIRQKLEEVNLFLQTQAASQEALEQMKAASEASLRAQLEQRIQDLESELNRLRSTQQDNASQKDSAQVQLERYRELYAEELKLRKSLAAKLERSNERLAEANTRLLHERQRSKSLIASSIVNGSLGGPSLDVGPLGSVGAYGGSLGPLNRSLGLGLGGSLLSPMANEPNSKVEAYLAKMQNELEKNISKELDKATVELEGRAARMSPVGSAGGSQWGLSADQDPVARATQQYLEVLKKNYKI